ADEALERWAQRVLERGVLPGGLDLIPPRPVGERDHGSGLERVEGAARLVQCVEQVSELPACGGAGVEHRARIGRDGGEQEVDVAESFREGGGPSPAQRMESRLRGRLGVRSGPGRWCVQVSSLARTAPGRKTRRDPVDSPAPTVPPHLLLPLPRGDSAALYDIAPVRTAPCRRRPLPSEPRRYLMVVSP